MQTPAEQRLAAAAAEVAVERAAQQQADMKIHVKQLAARVLESAQQNPSSSWEDHLPDYSDGEPLKMLAEELRAHGLSLWLICSRTMPSDPLCLQHIVCRQDYDPVEKIEAYGGYVSFKLRY